MVSDDVAVKRLIADYHGLWREMLADGAMPSHRAQPVGEAESVAIVLADRRAVWEELHHRGRTAYQPDEAQRIVDAYGERHSPPSLVQHTDEERAAIDAVIGLQPLAKLSDLLRGGSDLSADMREVMAGHVEGSFDELRKKTARKREHREADERIRAYFDQRCGLTPSREAALQDTEEWSGKSRRHIETVLKRTRSFEKMARDAVSPRRTGTAKSG